MFKINFNFQKQKTFSGISKFGKINILLYSKIFFFRIKKKKLDRAVDDNKTNYKNENNTKLAAVLSNYGTNRVLFASTYTAKQLVTMYYSLLFYSYLLNTT